LSVPASATIFVAQQRRTPSTPPTFGLDVNNQFVDANLIRAYIFDDYSNTPGTYPGTGTTVHDYTGNDDATVSVSDAWTSTGIQIDENDETISTDMPWSTGTAINGSLAILFTSTGASGTGPSSELSKFFCSSTDDQYLQLARSNPCTSTAGDTYVFTECNSVQTCFTVADQWDTNTHVLVFTFDDLLNEQKVYSDGVLQDTGTDAFTISDLGTTLYIGNRASDRPVMATLHAVYIWNTVLDGDDALSLYNNPYQLFLDFPEVELPEPEPNSYYVTQSGAGTGDGSTLGNAMSVSAHNLGSFQPNDIIYLSGNITSSIIPPSSGTEDNPIIYDGYEGGDCDPTLYILSFDNGSNEISVGDLIEGATSGMYGYVEAVTVSSGSWGGNNAAGSISIRNPARVNSATFTDNENLEINGVVYATKGTAESAGTVAALANGVGSFSDCSSAANIREAININGKSHITIQDFDFDWSRARFIYSTINIKSSGITVKNCHTLNSTVFLSGFYFPLVEDLWINNCRIDSNANALVGSAIEIQGGEKIWITDNSIDGGKVSILTKYTGTSNNNTSVKRYAVVGNTIYNYREEGISADLAPDGVYHSSFDHDVIDTGGVSGTTITFANANWGGGDDPDWVGYDALFLSGALRGNAYTIVGQSGADFTLSANVETAGAVAGDEVLIGSLISNLYWARNAVARYWGDDDHMLLYGLVHNAVLENNRIGRPGISGCRIQVLGYYNGYAYNDSVTGKCSVTPNSMVLIKNNTVFDDITYYDFTTNICSPNVGHKYQNLGTFKDNVIYDNSGTGYLYTRYAYYDEDGNTDENGGAINTDYQSGSNEGSSYGYKHPYIVSATIDGDSVVITWNETVTVDDYSDLYIWIDETRVDFSGVSGSGSSRTFTAESAASDEDDVYLFFDMNETDDIYNSSGYSMNYYAFKEVTNNTP
jgi:hypothetical protein